MQTFPIIQKAGGREAIAEIVTHPTKGKVGVDAIRMWEQRGRIPGYAIADLLRWSEAAKVPISESDFRTMPRKRLRKRRAS